MEKQYSVALYPSEDVIEVVKNMKELLASKTGWFNSKNSVAHITICEFKTSEKELEKIKVKLLRSADTFTPFNVHLNHFDIYQNGAFFIAPNQESKSLLKPIMKKTQQVLPMVKLKKSNDPHISIGRRLTPENIEIAQHLFTTIALDFLCNSMVLREFDPVKKQFFVIDSFSFNSNTQPDFVQGTLF
jgi:2'-5' RNA ligase